MSYVPPPVLPSGSFVASSQYHYDQQKNQQPWLPYSGAGSAYNFTPRRTGSYVPPPLSPALRSGSFTAPPSANSYANPYGNPYGMSPPPRSLSFTAPLSIGAGPATTALQMRAGCAGGAGYAGGGCGGAGLGVGYSGAGYGGAGYGGVGYGGTGYGSAGFGGASYGGGADYGGLAGAQARALGGSASVPFPHSGSFALPAMPHAAAALGGGCGSFGGGFSSNFGPTPQFQFYPENQANGAPGATAAPVAQQAPGPPQAYENAMAPSTRDLGSKPMVAPLALPGGPKEIAMRNAAEKLAKKKGRKKGGCC